MIETYTCKNEQIAIIIRNNAKNEGAKFFTNENLPQQVGIINYKKEHKITAHFHNCIKREITKTQETIIVKFGKLKLDLYSEEKELFKTTILNKGDIAILIAGGHGFYFYEDSEIIEIKQGPYLFEKDKSLINEADNA